MIKKIFSRNSSSLPAIFESMLDIVEESETLNKKEFISKAFLHLFKLIPEAQKGTLYELQGTVFVPIVCKGYSIELLKKLQLNHSNIHVGFDGLNNTRIDSYQIHVKSRDHEKFSPESLEILKKLGTYSGFHSIYSPIVVHNEIIGIFSLENFTGGFEDFSLRILKFFSRLFSQHYMSIYEDKLRIDKYFEIVEALVAAIELKDKYTKGHAVRVQQYSLKIAEKMNMPQKTLDNISLAALLHDVGKIGIHEEILNKKSPLTEQEFEIIKQHPLMSKMIIKDITGFEKISEIVATHHEYYDGSGYPNGWKRTEVPIESYIIQLADAYDTMTSERSYRKPLPKNKVLETIRKGSGGQFHPDAVKIALKYVFK
ncbi:MAG: HD-GYP domain-containing protein [Spirochaetes bacterium]|nr:HD-GYP domain-containing protein [Spirochaetota bacterium]